MPSTWSMNVLLGLIGLSIATSKAPDEVKLKFAEAPPAVRKTLQIEAPGVTIETVTREKDDDNETIYWADAAIGERTYAIGVLEDGTLSEMNLAFDDDEIPLDRCPKPVQDTFRTEAFGEKIEVVGKQMKYGVTIFDALVKHKGKSYEVSVAEDGTLHEKVLVISDEEIELKRCPEAVQTTLEKHANGGQIHDITRSSGIIRPTYEASVEIKGKVYLIEVDEVGHLISKTLDAGDD